MPIPGPLCSVAIIVPTEAKDNKGIPHTLEHLVFMGSKRYPQRGYLDKYVDGASVISLTRTDTRALNHTAHFAFCIIIYIRSDSNLENATIADC